MAISTEDQTKLLKTVIGLFNAPPGLSFLPDLESFIEIGGTQQALARALAETTLFASTLISATTSGAQAVILADNFGFAVDNIVGSPATQAINFFATGIDAGTNIGDLVYSAVVFLSNNPPAQFAGFATLLDNKAAFSAAYSATKGFNDNLSTLQSALVAVTGTSELTSEEIASLVATAPGASLPGNFTLTAAANSVTEGGALIYTVTASEAVATDTGVVFRVVPGDPAALNQGSGTTNLDDFISGTFNPVTITIPAGQTTATFTVVGRIDGFTELPETFTVEAVVGQQTLTESSRLLDSPSTQVVQLTTGVDNLVGGSGNEVFSGLFASPNLPNSQTNTLNISDTIDGSAGSEDTLNIVATADFTAILPQANIDNVEIINIRNIDGNNNTVNEILTVNGSSFLGHTQLNSDRSTDSVTFTNVASGASVGIFGNGNPGALANGAVVGSYVSAATSPILELANGVGGSSVAPAVTITAAGATSFVVNSTGAVNNIGALAGPASATSLTINAATGLAMTGLTAAGLTNITVSGEAATAAGGGLAVVDLGTATVANTVTTIDASGLTAGGLRVLLGTGVTSFVGGQGNDVVNTVALTTTADSQINAGAGDGDELIVKLTTDVDSLTKARAYAGFETLNVSEFANVDVSLFTNSAFTSLKSDGEGRWNNLTPALAADITLNTTGLAPNPGTTTLLQSGGFYGIIGAERIGQIDTLGLTIIDDPSLTQVQYISIAAPGVENINIETAENIDIQSFVSPNFDPEPSLSRLNITGSGDVIVTTGILTINANTIIDVSAATGTVTINASGGLANGLRIEGTTSSKVNILTGSNQNDLIIGGAGTDTITGNGGGDNIDGGAGNDTYLIGSVVGTPAAAVNPASRFTSLTSFDTVDTVTITSGDQFDATEVLTVGRSASGVQNPTAINAPQELLTALGNALSLNVAGTAPLVANAGYLVAITDTNNTHTGTYLVIESGTTPGFDNNNMPTLTTTTSSVDVTDTVIELVGISGTASLSAVNTALVVTFA